MTRILVVGAPRWNDARQTTTALRRVMETYRDPYTLLTDMGEGAGRYAAAAARKLGWTIEPHPVDSAKCVDECPPDHRKSGGPEGSWCPTAKRRNVVSMLDTADVMISLITPGVSSGNTSTQTGRTAANQRGIAVWVYAQQKGKVNGHTQR